jgi:hypothetical protein
MGVIGCVTREFWCEGIIYGSKLAPKSVVQMVANMRSLSAIDPRRSFDIVTPQKGYAILCSVAVLEIV